jgi:hypothetical protein
MDWVKPYLNPTIHPWMVLPFLFNNLLGDAVGAEHTAVPTFNAAPF